MRLVTLVLVTCHTCHTNALRKLSVQMVASGRGGGCQCVWCEQRGRACRAYLDAGVEATGCQPAWPVVKRGDQAVLSQCLKVDAAAAGCARPGCGRVQSGQGRRICRICRICREQMGRGRMHGLGRGEARKAEAQ
eukprot:365810-Chlamydomonas_euryale.AAC.27